MLRRTLSLFALLACAAVLSAQAAPPPVTAADLSALRFNPDILWVGTGAGAVR
jgi:hypothetical protein